MKAENTGWVFLNEKIAGWDPQLKPPVTVNGIPLVPVTTQDILNIATQSQNQQLLKVFAITNLNAIKAGIAANPRLTYVPTAGKDTANVQSILKAAKDGLTKLLEKRKQSATNQLKTGSATTRKAGQGMRRMGIDPQINLQLQLSQQQKQAPKLQVGKKVQETVNQLFDLLGEGAPTNKQAVVSATDGKKIRAKQMIAKLFVAQNLLKKPVLGMKQFDQLPESIRKAYPQQKDGILVNAKGDPIKYKPRDLDKAQAIMQTQIGPKYGSDVVKGLFSLANEAFLQAGFQNMGPAGKGKLPLYIGRWLDQTTNMVKIPSKNRTVTNPTIWKDKFNKSVYNMAYKWNSFVKSAQQVKNLVDNKTYWKDIVKSKVKANSLAVIKKRQLFNLLKSIGNGNAFYNQLPPDSQETLLGLLKSWNYPGVASFLQGSGAQKLRQIRQGQIVSPAVKRIAEYWSKFSQNALRSYTRFQVSSKIKSGGVMTKAQYKKAAEDMILALPNQVRATEPAVPFRTGTGGGFKKIFVNRLKKAKFQPQILERIQNALDQPVEQTALTRQQILDSLKGLDDDEDTQQLSFQNPMAENNMMNREQMMT